MFKATLLLQQTISFALLLLPTNYIIFYSYQFTPEKNLFNMLSYIANLANMLFNMFSYIANLANMLL